MRILFSQLHRALHPGPIQFRLIKWWSKAPDSCGLAFPAWWGQRPVGWVTRKHLETICSGTGESWQINQLLRISVPKRVEKNHGTTKKQGMHKGFPLEFWPSSIVRLHCQRVGVPCVFRPLEICTRNTRWIWKADFSIRLLFPSTSSIQFQDFQVSNGFKA